MSANNHSNSRLLPIRGAARHLGVSVATLRRMDKKGILVPIRTAGGHRRYSREMLDAYLKRAARPSNGKKRSGKAQQPPAASSPPSDGGRVVDPEARIRELERQLQEEQRRRETAKALAEATAILGRSLDLEQILNLLLDQLKTLVSFDSCAIHMLENDKLTAVAMRGFPAGASRQDITWDNTDDPAWQKIIKTKQPVLYPDVRDAPDWTPLPGLEYIRSWIGVPIAVRDWLWGIMTLDKAAPNFYTQEHADLAAAIARYAAIAIENARLYASAFHIGQAHQQRVAQLATLQNISLRLSSTFELDEVLHTLAAGALELTPAADAHIYFYDQETDQLRFGTALWRDGRSEPAVVAPRPDGLTATVARQGKSMLIDDARNHPLFSDRISSQWGVQAIAGFALKRQDRVIGVFSITYLEPHRFSADEAHILSLLADQAAVAIENARLYRQVQEYSEHLERQVAARTRQLREEKERAEIILTHAADGVILTDTEGNIEYVNPSWERQNGYTAAQALGQNPRLVKSEETPPQIHEELWATITQGRVWRGQLRNKRADGTIYDCDLIVAPVKNDKGEIINYVGVQRDITSLKELERMKDAFVSNVSHELRTPITNLKLYQNLMERGAPEKRDKYMQVIARETARLEQLVADLLDLSRLDRGAVKLTLEARDVNELVADVIGGLDKLAEQRQIGLEFQPEAGLPQTQLDALKITQAITNLVVNALNYTPAGGHVVVSTAQERDGIAITVRDNGVGIPTDELEHIFERFYRGQAARTHSVPGTGLGLAIVQEIVKLHSGKVSVESKPEQGSTFTLWLPVQ